MRIHVVVVALVCVAAACTNGSAARSPSDEDFHRESVSEQPAVTPDKCDRIADLAQVTRRGLYGYRSPEIVPIPKEPNFIGGEVTLVHSGPWGYLVDVPFVLYGPGHIRSSGDIDRRSTLADVAPTIAKLVRFRSYEAPDGKALTETLDTTGPPPRVVVNVVWDGGGWNALDRHADRWPYLRKLMQEGASYTDLTVGSSPSVTPATHTNLGTGAFPRSHGVVGLRMRTADDEYKNPLGGKRPHNIEVRSFSDKYDLRFGNKPVIGMLGSTSWHLGMIGKGSSLKGADKDIAVLMSHNEPGLKTNEGLYRLPITGNSAKLDGFINSTDASDGKRDGKWRGRSLGTLKDAWKTPALVDYTQFILQRTIKAGRFGRDATPDVLFVNFKSADLAGHAWSFNSAEVGDIIEAKDKALKRLVRFLDRHVGKERWVMTLTADHGMTPYPKDSGAWPVRGGELADDINRRFDVNGDDVRLVDRVGASGIYVNRSQLTSNDVALERIARWVGDYRIGENLKTDQKMPAYYQGSKQDRIFEAVLAKRKLVVPDCS